MKLKYSLKFFKLFLLLQNIYFIYSGVDTIIRIGEETYRFFQFSTNLNGDMIIDLSSNSSNSSIYTIRRFYGLKKNGRFYFNENNMETPFFSLSSSINKAKLNSVSYFIQLSGTDYYGKECIFSLSNGVSTVDFYDLDNKVITSSYSILFSRRNIVTTVNTLFKSKYQPNSNYYYILAYSTNQNPDKFFVRREYFESTTIQNIHDSNYNGPESTNTNIVSCFETSEYNIVCLFQNSNKKLEIYGYSQTSDQGITEDILVDSEIVENAEIFFKCIHFKDEIGVFMYYLSTSSTYPIISFKKYTASSGASSYRNYFDSIELNKKTDFNPGTLLNDIMTISDDKICIASSSLNKNLLYLVILNLFNDDTKMLISYYSVDLNDLNHKIYKDIKLYLYNNFITFGFSHCITSSCDDSAAYYSSLIIFNYPNISGSETTLDLIEYLTENNNDLGSLNINLSENIFIQNNIFGFEISSTKIVSISENINVYYKKNKTTILENYIIPYNDSIKISLDEDSYINGETYSIEYASIVKSSNFGISNAENYDYINFNDFIEIEEYFSENEYVGKCLYYNINIESQLSSTECTTEQCSLCYNNKKDQCVACNDGYYYNEDDSKCIIKPEEEEEEANNVQTTIISTKVSKISTTIIKLMQTSIINEEIPSTIPYIIDTTIDKEITTTTIPNIVETTIGKEITTTTISNIVETTIGKEITTTTIPNIIDTTIVKEITTTTIPNEINEKTTYKRIDTTTPTTTIPDQIKCSKEDIYENKCNNKIPNEQIQEIYSDIKDKLMHGQYNSSNNTIFQTKNVIFQVSTIKEQQNSNNINISSIDFDECEKKIKQKYDIKEEDELIIFKTDMHSDNSSAIYVQYEIYNPYTLGLIPLDVCKDVTININIPIFLDEATESLYMSLSNSGYNLFNSNDSFYNDICKTYTTENGTDITLLDRKSIIYENYKDVYLCQEGCTFISYNETTKKSKCNCNVQKKLTITDIKNIKFDKEEIVDNLIMSSLKNSNFKVIKCYKLVLSKEGEINNYGSYMLIGIIIILIVCMLLYFFNGNKKLNEFIQFVIKQKFDFYSSNVTINGEKNKKKQNKINMKKKPNKKQENNKNNSKRKDNKKNNNKRSIKKNNKKDKKDNHYPPKKNKTIKIKKGNESSLNKETFLLDLKKDSTRHSLYTKNNIHLNEKKNNKIQKKYKNNKNERDKKKNKKTINVINYVNKIKIYNNYDDDKINKTLKEKTKKEDKNNNIINIKTLNDEELNSLDYKQAVLIDKRTFCEYYFSLLKKKHLILFTFLPNNDYIR